MTNTLPALGSLVIITLLWPAVSLLLARRIARWIHVRPAGWRLAALFIGMLCAVEAGYTKVAPSDAVRIMYLMLEDDKTLLGPTNHFASAVGAAAVQEVLDENDGWVTSASNSFQWARDKLPNLAAVVIDPTLKVAWMALEVDEAGTGSNAQARCYCMGASTNADGTLQFYVHFNLIPAFEPMVPFHATMEDGSVVDLPAVSNSFPHLVSVKTPDGPADCYVYTVSVPMILANVALVPQSEIRFGGRDASQPFQVLGSLMINGRLGRTGEIPFASNKWWQFEGGAMCGVRDLTVTNSP